MVAATPPVLAQPAAGLVGVAVLRWVWFLMMVLLPPVQTEPAAGLVDAGAMERV